MKFTARFLQDGDYENILCGWWKDWKWEIPQKDFLPEEGKGGLMVSKDGVDICAGFMYFTNSNVAWCEWVVSNKDYRENDRKEAMYFLINMIAEVCKTKGAKYIFTSLNNQALIKKYEDCKYIETDKNCTQMVKFL